MPLTDVNVLVYAARRDAPDHDRYPTWLDNLINADEAYGVSGLVLSAFVRVVTHPRIFRVPSRIEEALQFAEQVKGRPQCVAIAPGPRHWDLFAHLCRSTGARGNLVPDAYFAALAVEQGCEWITTDRGYSRFPGLR